MILGVDGIRLLGPRSGVGRALEAILSGLGELDHPFDEIRVYTPDSLDSTVRLPPRARSIVLPSPLPHGLWEQLTLPRAHGRAGPLLCPSYVVPLASPAPTLLVHHGSYEGFPAAFAWWTRTRARLLYGLSAHRAHRVVTVSEHSKRDMVRFYRLAPERITVIPEGVDTRRFRPLEDPSRLAAWRRRVLGEDRPFLLYVGKPNPRRNLPSLLAAFAALKERTRLPHKLLLVGTSLPGTRLEQAVAGSGVAGDVITLGFASHEEVALAYNAAEMLVYPSAYEGFGMPVLEALACGTPAIALDGSAFPEFAAGVARLVPDAAPTTLARAIEDLLGDDRERRRMREEGPRRAAAYDWRRIVPRYLEILRELTA